MSKSDPALLAMQMCEGRNLFMAELAGSLAGYIPSVQIGWGWKSIIVCSKPKRPSKRGAFLKLISKKNLFQKSNTILSIDPVI